FQLRKRRIFCFFPKTTSPIHTDGRGIIFIYLKSYQFLRAKKFTKNTAKQSADTTDNLSKQGIGTPVDVHTLFFLCLILLLFILEIFTALLNITCLITDTGIQKTVHIKVCIARIIRNNMYSLKYYPCFCP